MKYTIVLAILIISFLSPGCVTTDDNETGENTSIEENDTIDEIADQPDDMNDAEKMVEQVSTTYTKNQSQKTVYAVVGDTIIVKLAENPTTGYSWNMTYSNGLDLQEDEYMDPGTDEVLGASGSHRWTFEVTETGEQSISAIYMRPWEEKTGSEDTFNLNIMVVEKTELITESGTVEYQDLEGGFYGIITDESRYDPINLPEQYKNDGMKIDFVAYPRSDLASFHMWGELIEIRHIAETKN